jgi:hypothetical protein
MAKMPNATECRFISQCLKLRDRLMTLDTELGETFARRIVQEWSKRGIDGMKCACFDIAKDIHDSRLACAVAGEAHRLANELAFR